MSFLDIVATVGVLYAVGFMACMFLASRSDRRTDPHRTHPPRSNVRVIRTRPFDHERD